MPPVIGDVIRVSAKMAFQGNDVINVYHYELTGGPPPTNTVLMTEIASMMDDLYATVDDQMTTLVTFESIEAFNVTQDELVGEASWPSLTAGLSTDDSLPVQTAPLILFNTDVARSQGRKFLPPFDLQSADAEGTPTPGILVVLAAYAAQALLGGGGTSWDLEPGNYNSTLVRFAKWASSRVPDFFATQRRRYLGRGT